MPTAVRSTGSASQRALSCHGAAASGCAGLTTQPDTARVWVPVALAAPGAQVAEQADQGEEVAGTYRGSIEKSSLKFLPAQIRMTDGGCMAG